MSSGLKLPPLPPSLKGVGHQIKTAAEHETRDPVVTYWCRLSALQNGMKLDKTSKEALAVILPLMDWLEKEKKVMSDNEAVTNDVVAAAHLENYAMKLFSWADKEDRASHFNKNVVKAFYTTGILFDVLCVFGDLTPENSHTRKYAKWKAAYIHNCLKNGETPIPGPAANPEEEDMGGGAGGWQVPQIPAAGPAQQPQHPPEVAPTSVPAPAPVPTPRASTQVPAPAPASPVTSFPAEESSPGMTTVSLTSQQTTQVKKYCRFAESAMDYDDTAAAIDNLQKALKLLQTGQ